MPALVLLAAAWWAAAPAASLHQRDVDADGRPELVLANEFLTLAIAPHFGAQAIRLTTADGFLWTPYADVRDPYRFGLFVDLDAKVTYPGPLATAAYTAEVLAQGPDEVAVCFRCTLPPLADPKLRSLLEGLLYEKTLRLRRDRPDIELHLCIRNPTAQARRVDYWQQSIVFPAGRQGVDVAVRPDTTGLSLTGGPFGFTERHWVHTPVEGWTATTTPDGRRAFLVLLDYHELKTLYNSASLPTTEFMFASTPLPPGKHWQTTIRAVPLFDLGRPIHAAGPVACGLTFDLTRSPGLARFHLAATGSPFRGARLSARLIDQSDDRRSVALAPIVHEGDVTWKAVALPVPLPSLDPTHDYALHVSIAAPAGQGATAVSLPLTVRPDPQGRLTAEIGVGPGFGRGGPARRRQLPRPDDLAALRARHRDKTLDLLLVADGIQGTWPSHHWPDRVDLPLARRWQIDPAAALLGPHKIDRLLYYRVHYAGAGRQRRIDDFPDDYDALFHYDAVVLEAHDNVALGLTAQTLLADYVRAGGGLVFLAGYAAFGKGRFAGSPLLDVLPVEIDGPWDLVPVQPGRFQVGPDDLLQDLTWPVAPRVAWMQKVHPRPDTRLAARVDDLPAIVLGHCGQGRTVAVAIAPLAGDGTAQPFLFDTDPFPRLMARLLAWVSGGCTP